MISRVRVGRDMKVDPRFGVDTAQLTEHGWDGVFGRKAPLVLEVGFGNGHSLAQMARQRPEVNFVGVEVYGKGIEKLGKRIARDGITNLRLFKADGFEVLADRFDGASLDEVHINFPDPWPKKRHHKRRLVAPPFVDLLFARVRPDGVVFLATDFTCYAYQMRTVFEAHPGFANRERPHRFAYHQPGRIRTKYEMKFAALGATIRYLTYRRLSS